MGLSRRKVHVTLDDPPIDVKVYVHHLENRLGERLIQGLDRVTIREKRSGHPVLRMGDVIRVRTVEHDRNADRWELEILP